MKDWLLDIGAAAVLLAFALVFVAFLVWLGDTEHSQKSACHAKGGVWSYSAARKANVCAMPVKTP